MQKAFSEAGEIDVLVNSAGFGVFGEFTDTDLDSELSLIDVNITALHMLTKLFLDGFVKRNSGYILNVASVAAFFPRAEVFVVLRVEGVCIKAFGSDWRGA